MAEVKRVSDQYSIVAPSIIIDGNLTITGSSTTVDTINAIVSDTFIRLNDGELGTGVTAGQAGIEIDRGIASDASFMFVESTDAWEARIGGTLSNIRAAQPVADNDVVTKTYLTGLISGSNPGGVNTSVQFNSSSIFGGDANFTYDGTNLVVFGTSISNNQVAATTTNTDLTLTSDGTGTLYLKKVMKLDYQGSDPTSTASTNKIYAKTPSAGGSGVYVVNPTTSDELVSKKRAIAFGLIF